MECLSYKGGYDVYVNIRISSHLKEELAWAINKQLWLIINTMLSSTSDLQPSTAIANQLPGQLFSTQIRTRGPNCFKFIIALIMPSRNMV